jgi:hypothetical protein
MFKFFVEIDYIFLKRAFDASFEVLADSEEKALEVVKRTMLISPIVVIQETVVCI